MNIKKIAVIGVGTIGCGWATFFAMKGLNVSLFDTQQSTLESAISRIKDNLTFLAESNYLTQDESCSAFLRIQICRSLSEALSDADFVQESIIENYEAKKALYAEMDRLALPNVILSSSSSGLLMSEIQTAAFIHPERCVIGHPINPVFIVPLVEIVPGRQTDPRIVSSLKLFLEEIGKVIVDALGHLVVESREPFRARERLLEVLLCDGGPRVRERDVVANSALDALYRLEPAVAEDVGRLGAPRADRALPGRHVEIGSVAVALSVEERRRAFKLGNVERLVSEFKRIHPPCVDVQWTKRGVDFRDCFLYRIQPERRIRLRTEQQNHLKSILSKMEPGIGFEPMRPCGS